MRDLLVALFVLSSMPVAFKRPVAGLMVFSLLAYMRIQDLTWGFARATRWSLYIALLMFAGWLFQQDRKGPIWTFRTALLVFLPLWMFIGLVESRGVLYAVTSKNLVEYTKIVGIAIFSMMVVRRREHLRAMMWIIGGSFAFFGVKNGAAAIASGGSLFINRGPGGMLEDNNDFALALAMSLPILVALATSETSGLYRKWLKFTTPLTVMSVLATRSRGGFLSVVIATFVLVWRSKNRVAGLALMGLAGTLGVIGLANTGTLQRLETLRNVEEDGSAMGRIAAWKVAGRMIEDQPYFGVGFNQFQANYLEYGPRVEARADGTRVAHNAYLQIWSEGGTPAFLAYMLLLILSILSIQRLRREANRIYERSWIQSYCTGFEGALITFLLGSMFLNRAHFDLIYHYFALIISFEVIARREMAEPLSSLEVKKRGVGGALVRREAHGFRSKPALKRGFRTTHHTPRGTAAGGGTSMADKQES
ncbi:MAG: putative O-glycosylation ligase, exosortase A system-associated [Planctomycetota bacterium]|nr:putative O-glycosylation ligase, exosortase A system-associated [Planctomycetota bacterium]